MHILQLIIERIIDFLTWLNIDLRDIVAACIMYLIVRGFFKGLKAANSEAGQIIRLHARKGHTAPLEACKEDNCIRLKDRQDLAQEQLPVVVLPQEYL